MDWSLIKQIKGLRSISQIGAATAGGNAIAAVFLDLYGRSYGPGRLWGIRLSAFYCKYCINYFNSWWSVDHISLYCKRYTNRI